MNSLLIQSCFTIILNQPRRPVVFLLKENSRPIFQRIIIMRAWANYIRSQTTNSFSNYYTWVMKTAWRKSFPSPLVSYYPKFLSFSSSLSLFSMFPFSSFTPLKTPSPFQSLSLSMSLYTIFLLNFTYFSPSFLLSSLWLRGSPSTVLSLSIHLFLFIYLSLSLSLFPLCFLQPSFAESFLFHLPLAFS